MWQLRTIVAALTAVLNIIGYTLVFTFQFAFFAAGYLGIGVGPWFYIIVIIVIISAIIIVIRVL